VRRSRVIAFFVAAIAAVGAPAAQAAAPPTLTGQAVDQQILLVYQPNGKFDCHDNPDGTIDITYTFYGGATGPYAGGWSESGKIHLGKIDDPVANVNRKIQSFDATFTFDSSAGQVSGSKHLAPSTRNDAGVFCSDFAIGYITAHTAYQATIVNQSGVFTDRGDGQTEIDQDRAGQPLLNYRASFTSSLSAPEQNESALFGPRVPGGSFSAMSANAKRASPFTLYYPATVKKLYAYVDGNGATSGSQTVRGVLYRNGPGNAPGALVAPTFQFTVPAGLSSRWVPLYLAPPTRLQPGVYWLGLQSDATNGVARFAWSSKPGSRRFNIDGYADGPTNPFGPSPVDNQQMSIYASGSF
jgi:hypothetical protein